MARAYKRPTDKARGKLGRYTIAWKDETGQVRRKVAFTDKAQSLLLAQELERKCRLVREGLIDQAHEARQTAGKRSVASHVEDYRLALLAKGDTRKHADRTANVLALFLADAGITSVAKIAPDAVQAALGRFRETRSARTANFVLGSVKSFCKWLDEANRIDRVPRGLASIPRYNEAADRRLIRRVITKAEIDRLLTAAEQGEPLVATRKGRGGVVDVWITGIQRKLLYAMAMATGFRAAELRSLTRESFHLDGDEPSITVAAGYAKNGKEAVQPITRELAELLRPYVHGAGHGNKVVVVPAKTAQLLRHDLGVAGIAYKDQAGHVLDFHALRGSYITHLVMSGVNLKIVQALARHSSITLTLDRYTKVDDGSIRKALNDSSKDP